MSRGIVFLVGAGPGDPGLITVRGKKLIDSADAIVNAALENRDYLPAVAKDTAHPEL
jgi:siroheme synthase